MNAKQIKRNAVIGILFFLPVTFMLFLYPAQHHYNTLDVLSDKVTDLNGFTSDTDQDIVLDDHLTVLGFYGNHPMEKHTASSNLKELIYDKFRGFKTFQVVIVLPEGTQAEGQELKAELMKHEELKYWHFVYGSPNAIKAIQKSLNVPDVLDDDLSTDNVYIIDKELNLRGRLDDRTDNEIAANATAYSKYAYDAIKVAELKNKMSEDVRILFTEYRQKRKGNFDSTSRRANDLKGTDE
ncbi:conserved hypothetical protein [Formosa agariphila KMM 3901]|uniref:Membrane or secreted protein n=1 Tax=Formosa agariphila (strain DSM 15362 / KCTC 12365 / LMG 23005 / KMM 3901 / M-2Alg 35-1) TaxID=1347342 RepID=T2KGM7_FORAG|nr:hypothetical protein [Formosa agariphila]CDF77957.1 conserved hypothetical protein [Formosa agariphila KMM 3901]